MASAEERAYNGGLGQRPQRGPGAEPLVGGQGRSPLKLKAFEHLDVKRRWQICKLLYFAKFNSTDEY